MGIYDRATREKVVLASGNIFLNVMGKSRPHLGGIGGERAAGSQGGGTAGIWLVFPSPGMGMRMGTGKRMGTGVEVEMSMGMGTGMGMRMKMGTGVALGMGWGWGRG